MLEISTGQICSELRWPAIPRTVTFPECTRCQRHFSSYLFAGAHSESQLDDQHLGKPCHSSRRARMICISRRGTRRSASWELCAETGRAALLLLRASIQQPRGLNSGFSCKIICFAGPTLLNLGCSPSPHLLQKRVRIDTNPCTMMTYRNTTKGPSIIFEASQSCKFLSLLTNRL